MKSRCKLCIISILGATTLALTGGVFPFLRRDATCGDV